MANWSTATFDSFQPDVVVHAAASYKDPSNWTEDARTNVLGTANRGSGVANDSASSG